MLKFDWLIQLKTARRPRRRNRKTGRKPLRHSTELLQVRTMLSGMALTAQVDSGDQDQASAAGDHDHGSGHTGMDDPGGSGEHGGGHGGMHNGVLELAPAAAASHTVVASGDWSDADVWQNGTLPTDGADVYIPAGMDLTVDGIIAETLHTVRIDGTLRFNPDVDTEIRVDTLLGSVGSRFEMGTADAPIADGVTARITVADTGEIDRAWDPFGLSRGVLLQGSSSIHGAAMSSWTTLDRAPLAGDTTLTLTAVPDNWNVGDSLVIAGTDPDATGDETVTISALNGTAVSLDQVLQHDHLPPRAEFQVHVANTTRNAVIESENPALDRRGHVMFMHNRDVSVSFGGFYELGRSNKLDVPSDSELDENGQLREGTGTNVVGRYSVHFHRNGVQTGDGPSIVTGSAVVGSPGWGFVNHSSYVEMTDNVAHNVSGAAFVTEAGDEIGSFIGNLSIRTHGTGDHPTERADDFGHAGDGFWFQGAGVSIENNVATGATGSGLILYNDALPQPEGQRIEFLSGNLPDPSVAGDAETVPVTLVPVRSFKGNTAYGSELGAQ
ncbi:MAG: G8 domain-containing protein, partial [Planctomycetaceae bacterium]